MKTIKKYRPKFSENTILRTYQMKELTSQAYTLPNLMHYNFTNGIISGFEVTHMDGNICISEGVICYGKEIILLNEETSISYYNNDVVTYIKILCKSKIESSNEDEYEFCIKSDEIPPTEDEIEICRFRLQKGAKLRTNYDGFDDMNTEFDTANFIYSTYSGVGKNTLSPIVLNRFATEMLSLSPSNPLDQSFCINILSSNTPIKLDGILAYLKCRGNVEIESLNNIKIYKEMVNILKEESKNTKSNGSKTFTRKKIILD